MTVAEAAGYLGGQLNNARSRSLAKFPEPLVLLPFRPTLSLFRPWANVRALIRFMTKGEASMCFDIAAARRAILSARCTVRGATSLNGGKDDPAEEERERQKAVLRSPLL
jgi:hypothetical protein